MRAVPGRLSPPEASGTPPGRSVRRTATSVLLLFLGTVAVLQAELQGADHLAEDASLLAYIGAQAAVLGLVLLAARIERRPLRSYGFVVRGTLAVSLLFSALLVFAFLVIEIYPGVLFGFSRAPAPAVLEFGFFLLSAPLVAVAQEAMFRGYLFRTLTRVVSLTGAMAISSGLFAAATTNFAVVPVLGEVAGGEYLFGTTIANLVLGLILSLYFYKSQWSLVGPVAVRTGILWLTTLLPVSVAFPNWETAFAALLLGYGVLFVVVGVAIREPRLQAHKYLGETIGPRRLRFRERVHNRRQVRDAVTTVAVVAVVAVGVTQLLPATVGVSPPMLAIATGSMVPTFYRGTLVVLERATPSTISVGTIIAFRVSCLPAPTVHRVIAILQGGSDPIYQTKGDHNPSPDPCHVPYSAVVGKVALIVPYAGLLVLDPLLDVAIVVVVILAALLVPGKERWRSR